MLDTATGSGHRLASPKCDNGPSLPTALGSGMLVWECVSLVARGGHLLVVDDLASGRRFIPPGVAQLQALEMRSADGARFGVRSAGQHWIYLTRVGYHYSDDVLVGLSGPQVLYPPAQGADVTVDPDQLSGTRRLCTGVRHRSGDLELGQLAYGALRYHRPYAITDTGRALRCAGAPHVPSGQLVTALGDRYLSWAKDRLVRIRPTTGGRTARRKAPSPVRAIALTDRFVYITTRSGTRTRVYRARIRAP